MTSFGKSPLGSNVALGVILDFNDDLFLHKPVFEIVQDTLLTSRWFNV